MKVLNERKERFFSMIKAYKKQKELYDAALKEATGANP
jgi:hypothetical protein